MKKFLTFLFLLLGISFSGTDTLEAYCSTQRSESDRQNYYQCLDAERRAEEQKRRYEHERIIRICENVSY